MSECYIYDGPVMQFDRVIANRWQGKTYAVSLGKARSNLLFQFKKQNNLVSGAKISFAGDVVKES